MKAPLKITSILAAFLAATSAFATTSDVVGYVTIDLPAGNSTLSVPMLHEVSASAPTTAVEDSGGNTILTFSEGSFIAGAYDAVGGSSTHYAVISDGSNEGLVLDIASNTSSTVTLTDAVAVAFSLTQNENIIIREHIKISDLIASATGLTPFVDALSFFNDDLSTDTYLWTGSNFVDNNFTSADSRPIYPGQGIVFFCQAPVSLVVTGGVSTHDIKVPVYAGGSVNFIGTSTPSSKIADGSEDVTLGSLGLGTQLTPFVGSVKLFATDGSLTSAPEQTYLWTGTNFVDGNFTNADDVAIEEYSAIVVSNNTDIYINIPEAYQENN